MIPGFVTAFRDKERFVHLYFFKGLGDDDLPIYNDIDLSNIKFKFDVKTNIDGSKDCKFYDKNIIKLHCKLITRNEEEYIQTLNI